VEILDSQWFRCIRTSLSIADETSSDSDAYPYPNAECLSHPNSNTAYHCCASKEENYDHLRQRKADQKGERDQSQVSGRI
jgi:hypothetical protein